MLSLYTIYTGGLIYIYTKVLNIKKTFLEGRKDCMTPVAIFSKEKFISGIIVEIPCSSILKILTLYVIVSTCYPDSFSQRYLGMRVANVYDIDNKTYLIKLAK